MTMMDVFSDGSTAVDWLVLTLVVGLAVSHGLTVWLTGSLFEEKQASLEATEGLRAKLLTCRLCLSWPWTTLPVFLALAACGRWCPDAGRALMLLLYSLAAAHVAVLLKRIGDFRK